MSAADPHAAPTQLSLPLEAGGAVADAAELIGSWYGGHHWVPRGAGLDRPAHVWFHFYDGGAVTFSLRHDPETESRVTAGTWACADGELEVVVDGRRISGPVRVEEPVLRWGGEVLLRVPGDLQPPVART